MGKKDDCKPRDNYLLIRDLLISSAVSNYHDYIILHDLEDAR